MAWREFDARYGELIVHFCHRLGLQHTDAEDIRQVVMVRLARALRTFRYRPQLGRFRSYLGRVVRNEVARHFRRPERPDQAVATQEEDHLGRLPDRHDADAEWEEEWVLHHLRVAMKKIRQTFEPRSVEVFERLLNGDPVDQVARAYGMTPQAVHKVKQRIRERLMELVERQVGDEDEPHG